MIDKLRECFDEMVVYKDLKKSNFFSALSLPSFLRDWLLKKFEDENGEFDIEEVAEFIKEFLPKKDDWVSIKDRVVIDNERVKFLAKVSIDIDIKTQEISFALPDFGLTNKQTIIEPRVWEECKSELVKGKEAWGVIELGYRFPEDLKTPGKIKLTSFNNFCPYTIDLDYYKDVRSEFTTEEWIDVLLGAIDYNAGGYKDSTEKIAVVTRLLPFVEKRLNLIELAPKGTGKSYLFGRVSKYGWLSSGGVMSRAKMFYDISKRTQGLVCSNDFVALDEVQTISFTDVDEMRAALKGYMESGVFTVGNYEGVADSGIVLLGNIKKESMDE
jgi:ATP-dependent Lon protease